MQNHPLNSYLWIFFFLLTYSAFSQATKQLSAVQDSLIKAELKKLSDSTTDVDKIASLTQLSIHYFTIDSSKSREYIDEIKKIATSDELRPFIYSAEGAINENKGLYQDAKESHQSFINTYAKLTPSSLDKEKLMGGYYRLAKTEMKLGQSDSSIIHLNKGMELIDDLSTMKNQALLARTYGLLGICYKDIKNLDKAVELCEQSINLKKKIGDNSWVVEVQNLAIVSYLKGRMSEALENMIIAAETFEKQGNISGAMAANMNTASILMAMEGSKERQRYYINKAVELSLQSGNPNDIANAYSKLAVVETMDNNNTDALKYNLKGLEYAEKTGDIYTIGKMNFHVGGTYSELLQYDSSAYYLSKCIDLTNKTKNIRLKDYATDSHRAMAWLYLEKKNYEQVIYHGNLYLQERGHNISIQTGDMMNMMSIAYENTGDYKKALESQRHIMVIRDSMLSIENIQGVTALTKDAEFKIEEQKTALLHNAEIAQQGLIQKGLGIGLGLIALLAFFIYRGYRNKQKANQLLESINRQIESQKEQLELVNETKDRIFAIIGHDMRAPAIAFRGIAKKVNYLLGKKDFARLEELGESIERDALGLNRLTDNLLNWALAQNNVLPHNPEQIQLSEIVEEVFLTLSRIADGKHIELKSEITASTMIMADKNALLTIVRNLVDNAIKFTPENGHVTITSKPSGVGVDIFIKDTGVGMDAEKAKSIFLLQKGKSTKGTSGERGTGLGLHLVYELVKLNEGNISVSSQEGEGTEFCLYMKAA